MTGTETIDIRAAMDATPPVIELNDEQRAYFNKMRTQIIDAGFELQDGLVDRGLPVSKALSVTANAFMGLTVDTALVCALIDGREPRQDWFIKLALDKWARAYPSTGDSPKEE